MSQPEFYMFTVYDSTYKVDTEEKYADLMNWLIEKTIEKTMEHPDLAVLVAYVVNPYE